MNRIPALSGTASFRAGLRVAIAIAFLLPAVPSHATTLFGLLNTGELYHSTDGGVTWSAFGSIPVRDAVGLAAATTASDLYLVSRSGSLYHSADGGSSWAAVGAVTASDVAALTLRPDGGILVLTKTGTLYLSADNGVSFTGLVALTGSNWVSLMRGPLGRYYALNETGEVKESQDSGVTWTTVGAVTVSNAAALGRKVLDLYMLMGTGEVARSKDYGRTWVTVGAMTASGMRAMAGDGTQLVAAAETGEIATSSNGVTWTWVGAINQLSVMALGTDTPLASGVEGEFSPPRFVVRAPYPNPRVGAGGATFPFTISGPDRVSLALYGVDGRLIASRAAEPFAGSGAYAIRWEPARLPAGTYVVRLTTASGRSASTKWTLAR